MPNASGRGADRTGGRQGTLAMPRMLHEVFGERQSAGALILVAMAAAGTAFAGIALGLAPRGLAPWRVALALALFADIGAGAVANFTDGTNAYYSSRARHRWLFIAIHWHPLAIAALVGAPLAPSAALNALVLAFAAVVNLLRGPTAQRTLAGWFFVLVVLAAALVPLTRALQAVIVLFALKVIVAFAVDHHR